jgi:hypothetical protein
MRQQLDEWRMLLAGNPEMMDGVQRRLALPSGVRLQFGAVDVAQLVRLAAAEQGCCRFMSFAITLDERGVGLEVQAPNDAIEIVHALFGAP